MKQAFCVQHVLYNVHMRADPFGSVLGWIRSHDLGCVHTEAEPKCFACTRVLVPNDPVFMTCAKDYCRQGKFCHYYLLQPIWVLSSRYSKRKFAEVNVAA